MTSSSSTALKVVNLRTEYLTNPLGIDVANPRFSWELSSESRGTLQRCYRIIVAGSSADAIEDSKSLVWDSGVVETRDSVHVVYSGPALTSRQRLYWRVQVTSTSGLTSEWSQPAWFEMGLLNTAKDWTAQWIEPTLPPVAMEPYLPAPVMSFHLGKNKAPETRLTPPSLLRREFNVKPGVAIKRARIYATAHGIYALEVNGKPADDRQFAPEFTAYGKVLCYQTYDVTLLLTPGANALGATIADGWWAGRVGMTGDSCQYGNKHGLLLQLEIDYDDGSSEKIVSDNSFTCSTGPIIYSDIFIGERYDARLSSSITGWTRPNFNSTTQWKPVSIAQKYGYNNLVAQHGEPVRRVIEIPASKVITTPKGDTVVDLGQVIAGRIKFKVSGPAGTIASLEHSEVLDEKGNFINNIAGRNKDQKDVYVLSGTGVKEYEPAFTFHGFRFVKLVGWPGTPKASDFIGIVLSSDMAQTGTFTCSDPLLNRLQQNIVWSQRGNMLSLPTDCPQRERVGWTGDIQVYAPTASFNMDVDAFLTRWLQSLAAEQFEDGQVPFIIPYLEAYRRDVGGAFFTDCSAGWSDACILVPLTLYRKYGDKRILEQLWPVMTKWMSYVEKRAATKSPLSYSMNPAKLLSAEARENEKYLWNTSWHFGDWLIPSRLIGGAIGMMSSGLATKKTVASAYYAYTTSKMAEIAGLLGKESDRQKYLDLNSKIKKAFADEYIGKDGSITPSLQGIYVIGLEFGLFPPDVKPKAVDKLVSLIRKNGDRLDTGFLSVPHLMDVLCREGFQEVAWKLLYQDKCPSWLWEVKNGGTTIWESWRAIEPNGKVTDMSYNHYAL